jgi:hypothetical protein
MVDTIDGHRGSYLGMRRGEERSSRRHLRIAREVSGLLLRPTAVCLVAGFLPACGAGTWGRRGESDAPAHLITTRSQAESGYSTEIVGLDGHPVSSRSNLRLQPGRHRVYVEGKCDNTDIGFVAGAAVGALLVNPIVAPAIIAGATMGTERSVHHSGRLRACFIARSGRTYEVRTYAEGGVWKVEVVDQTTTFDVKSPCKDEIEAPLLLTGGPDQPRDPFDR